MDQTIVMQSESSMSDEEMRYDFLSDRDVLYVYSVYPESKKKSWCPTCNGSDANCDHELQRQLFKHYANAGIGLTYQRLSWKDYNGPEDVKKFCQIYASQSKAFKENNVGLMLLGNNGTGKTTVMSLLLKDLVRQRAKCFFTTYSNLVQMLGGSFYDEDARRLYADKIIKSTFLAIDDIGKEMANKLTVNAIDNVLRQRVQASRPTFLTSNMTRGQIMNEYGRSAFSLIAETSNAFDFDGYDVRPDVRKRKLEDAAKGIIHPII